jgi:ribosomal protein L37E
VEAREPPRCPRCSFIVFNRRYPKCESCGAELPKALLYSQAEREELRKSEAEQLEDELERRKAASREAAAAARQAAAVVVLIATSS